MRNARWKVNRLPVMLAALMLVVGVLAGCGSVTEKVSQSAQIAASEKEEKEPEEVTPEPEEPEEEEPEEEETPAGPEETNDASLPDTTEKVFAALQTKDNVLFDRDGMRLTFDGFDVEGGRATPVFSIENNNTDNKKFFVDMLGIYINRFLLEDYIELKLPEKPADSATDLLSYHGVEAGSKTSVKSSFGIELRNYETRILDVFGLSPQDFPAEQIGFAFEVKIGSNGEEEPCVTNLDTTLYDGESYRKYFGDRLTSLTGENESYYDYGGTYELEVYGKMENDEITVVLLAPENGPAEIRSYDAAVAIAVNGEVISNWTTELYYRGFGQAIVCGAVEEDLRRSMEIASGDSLEIQLSSSVYNVDPVTLFTR